MTENKPLLLLAEGPLTKEALLNAAWENDLSPRHDAAYKIARLTLTNELKSLDHLTGSWDRNTFLLYVATRAREEDATHILILQDMVGLGKINDFGGQKAGDEALKEMAKMFRSVFFEEEDYCLARLGGDEFGLSYTWPDKVNPDELGLDIIRRISEIHERNPQVAPIRMWYTEVKSGDTKDKFMPAADPKQKDLVPFVSYPTGLVRRRLSSKNYLQVVPEQ